MNDQVVREVQIGKANLQRHSRLFPCPVCGGHSGLPRERGVRCAGFSLRITTYCTRHEHAGRAQLDIETHPPAYKHLLSGRCPCGLEHDFPPSVERPQPRIRASSKAPDLSRDEVDAIYTAALSLLDLRPEARADLRRRGLTDDDVREVGYCSLPRRGSSVQRFLLNLVNRFGERYLRRWPGFVDKNGRTSFRTSGSQEAYAVPYRDETSLITGLQFKFVGGKYETARGTRTAGLYHIAGIPEPGGDLYLTEGGIKAHVAHRLGEVTVMGLAGQSLSAHHVGVIATFTRAESSLHSTKRTIQTPRAQENGGCGSCLMRACRSSGLCGRVTRWAGRRVLTTCFSLGDGAHSVEVLRSSRHRRTAASKAFGNQ